MNSRKYFMMKQTCIDSNNYLFNKIISLKNKQKIITSEILIDNVFLKFQ